MAEVVVEAAAEKTVDAEAAAAGCCAEATRAGRLWQNFVLLVQDGRRCSPPQAAQW